MAMPGILYAYAVQAVAQPRVVRSVTDKVLQMHSDTMAPLIRYMLHVKALLR